MPDPGRAFAGVPGGRGGGGGGRVYSDRDLSHVRDTKYILKKLWHYISAYKAGFLGVLALTLLSNGLAVLGPRYSGMAIDAVAGKGQVDFSRVLTCVMMMLGVYVLNAILGFLSSVLMIRTGRNVVLRIRNDLFSSIAHLPVGYTDANSVGDILSKVSYDIDTIHTSVCQDVVQILASLVTVVGSLYMMISISPLMVLVFAFTIPLAMFVTRFITTRTRPLFRARSRALGRMNGYVEEMCSGLRTNKAYSREDAVMERFDERNGEACDAYYRAEYYGGMTGPSVNFVNNVSLSLVSCLGAILFMTKGMSLGAISAFVLYSRRFSGPINEVANIIADLQSAFAAGDRVFRLIDEEPETSDRESAKELENARGDVEMKHVCFGYDPKKPVLHDVSLRAKPGSVTAIVGHTGAGKTTIVNLLMRFYDKQAGDILVDSVDIEDIKRGSLRRSYAMVLQDTWLFEGTVAENIAYGNPKATREDVERAARMARVSPFIEQLPDGYDTVISENGGNISKGQKQLLTIARAMLLDANMLILDEATSNVDSRTELRIQEAMLELMRCKTCFIIAHRLSTIQNADNILVMDGGDIVEQGMHSDLMKKENGFYRALYTAQFEN